jgi:hypothetical protein
MRMVGTRYGHTQTRPGLLNVYNGTGIDLARFSVVGLQSPKYGPSDNLESFKNGPPFVGATPASGDDGRFAIFQAPCAQDNWAPALLSGVTPVKINVTDDSHGYADIAVGDSEKLASAASGSATILWKESGTGEKWAVVRLGSLNANCFIGVLNEDLTKDSSAEAAVNGNTETVYDFHLKTDYKGPSGSDIVAIWDWENTKFWAVVLNPVHDEDADCIDNLGGIPDEAFPAETDADDVDYLLGIKDGCFVRVPLSECSSGSSSGA